MILKPELENFLKDLGMGANQLGHELYIVGGFVREKLYSELYNKKLKEIKDIDLVINTDAIKFTQQFQQYYEDNHPLHKTYEIVETFPSFGTCKILHPDFPEYTIELASTRKESYPEAADFPQVELIKSIMDDLPRRDFTINALLLSLNKKNYGEIIDHVDGISDLEQGLVRVFHKDSFLDDPTRILRAIRFALKYNFKIELETETLIKEALMHPELSNWLKKRKTRFQIELEKIDLKLSISTEFKDWIATLRSR